MKILFKSILQATVILLLVLKCIVLWLAAYISQIVLVKCPSTIRSKVLVAYTVFSEEGNQLNFTALLHRPVRKTNTVL